MSELAEPPLSEHEVQRRMPSLSSIDDDEETIEMNVISDDSVRQ
jgi:hypothetical protein